MSVYVLSCLVLSWYIMSSDILSGQSFVMAAIQVSWLHVPSKEDKNTKISGKNYYVTRINDL